MRSEYEHKAGIEDDSYRELRLLEEVHRSPEMSQRSLSSRLGIALGVTNVLVRGLAKKGYIRIVQVKWRRWIYILTPAGITHKINLTFAYVERFLNHYRRVRLMIEQDLESIELTQEYGVAIFGTTELAELVFLILREKGITDIDIIDVSPTRTMFLGMPVLDADSIDPQKYRKILLAFPLEDTSEKSLELETRGIPKSQIVYFFQGHDSGQEASEPKEMVG